MNGNSGNDAEYELKVERDSIENRPSWFKSCTSFQTLVMRLFHCPARYSYSKLTEGYDDSIKAPASGFLLIRLLIRIE